MLLSHPSSYAIRALLYLATQPPGKLTGTREISAHEGIPNSYLGKILLQLRRGRLLRSYKGIGGGYELAQAPECINLLMVLRCTGGEEIFERCLLHDRKCPSQPPCALHDSWTAIRDQIQSLLERSTLADLVRARDADPGHSEGEPGGFVRLTDK